MILKKIKITSFDLAWWLGIFGLLLLTQVRNESLLHYLQNSYLSNVFGPDLLSNQATSISNIVTPLRGILFLYSLLVISYPIILSLRTVLNFNDHSIYLKYLGRAIFLFFVLCVIFVPGNINGLAKEYSNTSLVLFSKFTTVNYNSRFLMPALAYLLFFRGDFFFLLFSFICALTLLFVIQLWFDNNKIKIYFWQLVSLGTLSFISFQIRAPGYPDVLVNIFILLAFLNGMSTQSRLSLFALSLATHEASIFIWFVFALIMFDKKGLIQFFIISILYILLLLKFNGGLEGLSTAREFGEASILDWIVAQPMNEIVGILVTYKALWGIIICGIWYFFSQKKFWDAFKILLLLGAGIVMTFMGTDTTRLFGWTFMAVLLTWKVLNESTYNWEKAINILLFINLILPSIDLYLFTDFYILPGIYQHVFGFLVEIMR